MVLPNAFLLPLTDKIFSRAPKEPANYSAFRQIQLNADIQQGQLLVITSHFDAQV